MKILGKMVVLRRGALGYLNKVSINNNESLCNKIRII